MSHYSLSVKLLEEGAFYPPGYQMEDTIAFIRFTIITRREIHLRPLILISINGPTPGANYLDEIHEWTLEVRRWIIGAGEVFHYFIVKLYRIPGLNLPITWATRFFIYYGLILCASAIFCVVAPISVQLIKVAAPEHVRLFVSDHLSQTICFNFSGSQYVFRVTVLVRWNLLVPGDNNKKDYNSGFWGIFQRLVALDLDAADHFGLQFRGALLLL